MPRISFRPAEPRNTRETLLLAWLNRHRAETAVLGEQQKLRVFVSLRLRSLVGQTAGVFPDIDPGVQSGGRGCQVGWDGEPYAADGHGVDQFNTVLDRLGPVAIELVRVGLAELAGPELAADLRRAGVPEGSQKPQIGWLTARDGGGQRILTLVGDEFAGTIQKMDEGVNPTPPDSWAAYHVKAVADPFLLRRVRDQFVARALTDLKLFQSIAFPQVAPTAPVDVAQPDMPAVGDGPDAIVEDGYKLCSQTCPSDRKRQEVTGADLDAALKANVGRWTGRGRRAVGALDRPMKVRLAHTLIDPEFFLSVGGGRNSEALTRRLARAYPDSPFHIDFVEGRTPWWLMYQWLLDQGFRSMRGQARRSGLRGHDLDDYVQANLLPARDRLIRHITDSYIDPDGEPRDWDRVLRNVTTLHGLGKILKQSSEVDLVEDFGQLEQTRGRAVKSAWAPSSRSGFDPVETDYWRTRDSDLLLTKEFADFLEGCPPQDESADKATADRAMADQIIAEVVFLAEMLLQRAADEVGFVAVEPSPAPGAPETVWYQFDGGDKAEVEARRRHWEQQLAEVRYLFDLHLDSLLRSGYRTIPETVGANQLRSALGRLFAGVDIAVAFMRWKPAGRSRGEWANLSLVAQTAVHRAVYLVLGRAALAEDPDQGSLEGFGGPEELDSYGD